MLHWNGSGHSRQATSLKLWTRPLRGNQSDCIDDSAYQSHPRTDKLSGKSFEGTRRRVMTASNGKSPPRASGDGLGIRIRPARRGIQDDHIKLFCQIGMKIPEQRTSEQLLRDSWNRASRQNRKIHERYDVFD